MKNELFWFKFIPDDWLIGDITIEDYEIQGVFINVCAYYWKRGENGVAMARLKARYKDVKAGLWQRLIDCEVMKVDENQIVRIEFLDDQREEILKEKQFLSNAGKKGAKARWGGNSNIDIDIDKEQDKEKIKSRVFKPPTLEEVISYCRERENKVDAERFINFYEAKGWMIGKNKIKNWKAAVRNWEKSDKDSTQPSKHFNPNTSFPE